MRERTPVQELLRDLWRVTKLLTLTLAGPVLLWALLVWAGVLR